MTGHRRSGEHETIRHGRVSLALHTLQAEGTGPQLLLLHALYGSSADWDSVAGGWPGAVYALDFSGHGESDWLPGRGYAPEVFAAEADAALAALSNPSALSNPPARSADSARSTHSARSTGAPNPVYLAGAGVGAYVALLLAGGRTDDVTAALLLAGEGFDGGGALPSQPSGASQAQWLGELSARAHEPGMPAPDPLVARCARDVRPCYYAEEFARAAGPLLVANTPETPPWLETAIEHGNAVEAPADPAQAIEALARIGAQ